MHLARIHGLATQREFNTSTRLLVQLFNTFPARQTQNRINIKPLISKNLSGRLNLPRLELSAQHSKDISVLTLMPHPILVLIVANGRKADIHAQLRSLKQQLLHRKAALHLVHAHQNAQRKRVMNISLADVQHRGVIPRQNSHNRSRQSRPILSRNPD